MDLPPGYDKNGSVVAVMSAHPLDAVLVPLAPPDFLATYPEPDFAAFEEPL